jgi:hypothetical protein
MGMAALADASNRAGVPQARPYRAGANIPAATTPLATLQAYLDGRSEAE